MAEILYNINVYNLWIVYYKNRYYKFYRDKLLSFSKILRSVERRLIVKMKKLIIGNSVTISHMYTEKYPLNFFLINL